MALHERDMIPVSLPARPPAANRDDYRGRKRIIKEQRLPTPEPA